VAKLAQRLAPRGRKERVSGVRFQVRGKQRHVSRFRIGDSPRRDPARRDEPEETIQKTEGGKWSVACGDGVLPAPDAINTDLIP